MSDPWFKFYSSDWRADPALRLCSRAARGLWIDMLTIMHEATPRGELRVASVVLDEITLARAVGEPLDEVKADLAELEAAGVFSRRKNGVIYSRRMVRDEEKRRKLRENGAKGGNPTLCNKTKNAPLDNQGDKTTDTRSQRPDNKRTACAEVFKGFWQDYPRKAGTSKAKALKAFERLGPDDRSRALSALPTFCQAVSGSEERFIPHAATWLNERRFETLGGQKTEASPERWRHRLERFQAQGYWDSWLGPRPTERGCECPAELLQEFGYGEPPRARGAA